jgi:hypothetical protein
MNNSWENDYVLLNTDKWKVPVTNPYKCKQEKESGKIIALPILRT